MNALAYKEFNEFLATHTDYDSFYRISLNLKEDAYRELISWKMEGEATAYLDNKAQSILILLILEASK
jgi:hypothetical protein